MPKPPKDPRPIEPRPSPARWAHWLLVAAVLLAFGRVVTDGIAPIDDADTIFANPRLSPKDNPPRFNSDGVLWYWAHEHMGLYIPVTYSLWGVLARLTWVP